jgi:hypothetical protein
MRIRITPDFRVLAFFFLIWAIFNITDGVLENNSVNTVKGAWILLLGIYLLLAAEGFNIILTKYKR